MFFYSGDRTEPMHVHVERGAGTAKVWIEPVRLAHSRGFGRTEINAILRHIHRNRQLIVREWDEFFNG
jgi:hypothetical protein